MKIGIYVVTQSAKANYKNENFDVRQNAGVLVVKDILKRKGFSVDYCGRSNIQNHDVVLFSVTSDCDFYPLMSESTEWERGNYKTVVGGAGVLNVRPFLNTFDFFVLGRAEGVIEHLMDCIKSKESPEHESIIESKSFDLTKKYKINQVEAPYPHKITLDNGKEYKEGQVGCNRRCLFCGYTWHRRGNGEDFEYGDLWNKNKDVEIAMLNYEAGQQVNFNKLRTTAIDGLSEKLRIKVNKPINRETIVNFMTELANCDKPHQTKFYNIIGYPWETEEDWFEFLEDIKRADEKMPKREKQASILLHSTPFRAMPATPLACQPMQYKNYRNKIADVVGRGYKGNIFYQGNSLWAVESMGTESLPTVIESAIVIRGDENDEANIIKLSRSKKYRSLNSKQKTATLEKYFDVQKLFGSFTPETLPTKYLKSYAKVEKMWVEK